MVTLNVSIDEYTPTGTQCTFYCNLEAGAYSTESEKVKKIGLVVENFETGDFTSFNWSLSGGELWHIVDDEVGEGQYSAKSGAIGNSAVTLMQLDDFNVLAEDSVAFMVKVSSEAEYDYLYFYINNTKMGEWEGEEDWQRVAFPVEPGEQTLRWLYKKDQYEAGGQDCAWVDFIELPAMDLGIGVEEINTEIALNAMPNPASETLTIRINNPENQEITLELRSLDGKEFRTIADNENAMKGVHTFKANLNNLSGGVYILSLRSKNTLITKKVIIQK